MKRDLRVLMTADTVGGVFTYACGLIEALRPLGVDVALATMGAPLHGAQARALAAMPNVEVFESSFALEWMPEPWREVDAAGDWLYAISQLVRPHVVHLNSYAHATLPFEVPVVVVAHACACSWHRAVHGQDAGPEWTEYRDRARAGMHAASITVAPTAAILRDILRAVGAAVPTRVIPNGRHLEVAAVPKESFVLAAGQLWDEAQGLATLEAAAKSIAWPIRVVGPLAPPGEPVRVRAGSLETLGELEPTTMALWMSRAAIYAHPALYEPFGVAAVDAALAGCALVLSDLPSLREVWGESAVYTKPGDPAALAYAVDSLVRDALRRAALAGKARARARSLTPARMAEGYHALYVELIDRARGARGVCA